MDEVSGRKSIIQFSHICLARGQKSSKSVITQEGQGMGTNQFRLFLVSSGSTNWSISDSKRCVTLGDLPSLARFNKSTHAINVDQTIAKILCSLDYFLMDS